MPLQQLITKKNLDISIVELKDLEEFNRIDPEYYRPIFLLAAKKPNSKPIGDILTMCEYGLSIAMNEEWIGRKILRMNDLVDGVVVNDDLKYADITDKEYEKCKVVKNDILFNRVNSIDFVWRTWIFKWDIADSVFASYLIRIRTNKEVEPDFLNIFLNCKFGKLEILRKARRAVNQANVNAEELKRIKLPIAKKELQDEITRLSNESFEKREQSKSLYHQAEQLLIKELGLEKYQPAEKNISIKNSHEVEIFSRMDAEFFQPKYDEIVEKIKGYKWWYDILDNLIEISDEKIKQENDKIFQYVELADIDASNGLVNEFTEIEWQDLPSRAQMKIRKNDVVLSSVAWSCSKIALITSSDDNLVASTGFFILRSKFFNPETNLILMKSWIYQEFLKRTARGMILEATNKDDFKKYILPKVDKKVQERIVELVNQSHKARNESKKLLEVAKKAVEIFIEENEAKAMEFVSKNI